MNQQPQQRFCTNCGKSLTSGAAYCVECGAPVTQASTPSQSTSSPASPGSQPVHVPPYAQVPAQSQDNALQDLLMAGMIANQIRRRPARMRRVRRRSSLRGCSCLLLVLIVLLVVLAGPFVGLALTTGQLHQIFLYVAVGLIALILLVTLIGMLATRGGREALFEGLLDGLFGGG